LLSAILSQAVALAGVIIGIGFIAAEINLLQEESQELR
jgi:hypothetical protein